MVDQSPTPPAGRTDTTKQLGNAGTASLIIRLIVMPRYTAAAPWLLECPFQKFSSRQTALKNILYQAQSGRMHAN